MTKPSHVIHGNKEAFAFAHPTDTTYTAVINAINQLDDAYRKVRAELQLLAMKGVA